MFKVLLCVQSEHNIWLVGLAALVCLAATQATFYLYSKVPSFPRWRRWAWLAMTGLVAGSGIWTTHFVAMLAFETGLPTGYDAIPTGFSLLVAVVSTAAGFAIASEDSLPLSRTVRAVAGGLAVGLGITFMHYVGMLGFRTAGHVRWDAAYVAGSVALGALLASPSLVIATPGDGWGRRVTAGLVLMGAIVAMHFTGMTAVTIVPDAAVVSPSHLLPASILIACATAVAALIMVTAIGGVAFDTATRNGSLRRLRQALDVMPDGLAFYDASDRLVAWNAQYEELCLAAGVPLRQGLPFAELLEAEVSHGAYPDARGRKTEWLAEREAVWRGERDSVTHHTAWGRWLRITDRRTVDGGTVTVSVDITDLKAAELDMTESRNRAEEMARRAEAAENVAGLGHWRTDLRTRAVTWSPQMYAIYGLDPGKPFDLGEVTGMTHAEDKAAQAARLDRWSLIGDQDADCDRQEEYILRIVRPDGEVRALDAKSSVERDRTGAVTHIIGAVVDITDQKRLEADLRHARAEAEAALAVKSEFLANMSHELRTPLTSIIGFTNLAVGQPDLPDIARSFIERVRDASQALLCTVNDILDFSKLEAGQASIHPAPTDLGELCRSTLQLFTPQAGAKDLDLVYDGPEAGELVLSLDPDRIRQVLLNLVGNAVKFTPSGEVCLSVHYGAEDNTLAVQIADTGAGISSDKIGCLFQRFSQIDGSLTRTGGSGLGLAICKGLVELMGGRIGVDSTPGAGSRFWFTLPASAAAIALPSAGQTDLTRLGALAVRVLVVDDHPANRQVASLFLSGIGAEVTEAADGEEAVALAAEWPYDVILMDLRMPRLDGPGALRRIRREGGLNDQTPILAFTADADHSMVDRLQDMGFDGMVPKPIDSGALMAAVAAATSQGAKVGAGGEALRQAS
ncbi:MAG TPA: MHYT domain-containing protein [Caulobacteraceae bacterium]